MPTSIPVDKDLIPYSFEIQLSNRTYTIAIDYNQYTQQFSASLSFGDIDIVTGEIIAYGKPLFDQIQVDKDLNLNPLMFSEVIYPISLTAEFNEITYDNFYNGTGLYIFE